IIKQGLLDKYVSIGIQCLGLKKVDPIRML
ncbi:hypothetical protein EVA_21228, partial [gut metagenome]